LWSKSRVFCLSPHPTEPRTVLAGTDDGIYRSQDGGESFERLSSPMNDLHVWKIAIDPIDPSTIFAGTRPSALFPPRTADAIGKIYRLKWPRSARPSASPG
jgi:hypothetical protein